MRVEVDWPDEVSPLKKVSIGGPLNAQVSSMFV